MASKNNWVESDQIAAIFFPGGKPLSKSQYIIIEIRSHYNYTH